MSISVCRARARMRVSSRRACGVARHDGGSPAVEFALAAPVLLLLMAAIVEFGTIMFVTVLMEGGLREAARWGITGQTPEDGDRAAHILEVVADRTLGLVDVSKATVKITAYPSATGKWDNDRGKSDAGGAGDAVVYEIDYDWPLLTSLMTPLIGKDGKFHIQANAVVRNEPWDGSGGNGARELQFVNA